jgi:DmsE family decaheme c-type cytochrome
MENLDPEKNRGDVVEAHKSNLLNYKTLPAGAKSLVCLKCHTQNAEFNLHNWSAGAHALSEVSCVDCHDVHAGPDLISDPRHITDLCLKCHMAISAEFSMPSHHPLKEKKLYCTDCHEPHGSPNAKLLRQMTQKETCGRCHTEKVGPFVHEHGDITEDCSNCHKPHGSINNNLLTLNMPYLCRQCHVHHRATDNADLATAINNSALTTKCTKCHSNIHGTDSASDRGRVLYR